VADELWFMMHTRRRRIKRAKWHKCTAEPEENFLKIILLSLKEQCGYETVRTTIAG